MRWPPRRRSPSCASSWRVTGGPSSVVRRRSWRAKPSSSRRNRYALRLPKPGTSDCLFYVFVVSGATSPRAAPNFSSGSAFAVAFQSGPGAGSARTKEPGLDPPRFPSLPLAPRPALNQHSNRTTKRGPVTLLPRHIVVRNIGIAAKGWRLGHCRPPPEASRESGRRFACRPAEAVAGSKSRRRRGWSRPRHRWWRTTCGSAGARRTPA